MADAPEQPTPDPPTPPQEAIQMPKKNKKGRRKKPKKAAAAAAAPSSSGATMVEDPFLVLAGGKEGGFLELEEIDGADFGIFGSFVEDVGASEKKAWNDQKKKKKKKKRKRGDAKRLDGDVGGDGDGDGDCAGDLVAESEEEGEKGENKRKRKKRNKKKRKVKDNDSESKEDVADDNVEDMQDDIENMEQDNKEEVKLGEDELYAWLELRLHPLLIKAMHRLGFNEPTPIQKACIPAGAHQGKDVIGAAETGSGKTLAFGLPILQRLLEERDKTTRLHVEDEKVAEGSSTGGPLRALILTPTRELAKQVCDHLKEAAKFLGIHVVPIVGGLSMEKQERLLKKKPEIVVGTPGRLWELMSSGNQHLVELHSLSFFVLDEADRMIERGHFKEVQSIIEMLPLSNSSDEQTVKATSSCETVANLQIKKRQTFVFSATLALSANFRKKLKRGLSTSKASTADDLSSIEELSKQAGMKPNAEIVDLTNASILPEKLEESFIECSDDDKDANLYYILSVHGQGRTIVFCTSISALRHISSLLRTLGINVLTNHAQMQQRARMKAVDRFREGENSVLVATDGFARGMDFDNVRTVIHYQLPHSSDVYIHRSGRTARKSLTGCSIALISPADKAKFYSLCKSFSKENLQQFPVDQAYMPAIMNRLSLARQIDKISSKSSKENANKSWLQRNAESMGLILEASDSEEERVRGHKQRKATSAQLQKLQQDLNELLQHPLQPKTFSRRYLAGAGISPLLQKQLEELSKRNVNSNSSNDNNKGSRFVIIGQDRVEPLQALQDSGQEICVNMDKQREKRRLAENWRRKKHEEKKSTREQKRKDRRSAKERD
ncbi:DEAD-box ATP-dependent RNA helicase 13-like [Triticum urartu]|uniref:DEAD-box ATP-dependent RNA helicase 13 n=1 Tax=Triticum urartu TaxID=4572 RepID=A0A8R7PH75_TRIUA|nr:DEAD-box ATP-dependent RNA helicase 13-like [Triticum urartu]XP_048558320.1 DEAD-box ATP-dependent RNA helicase 13-like [Triticum urartu]